MSRLIKLLLAVVAAVVVLILGIAVAALLLVDPNDYRDEIAALVEEQTGREFAIDGELSLRVLPCCAVAIDDTRLGNPAGFAEPDFASVESVRLGLQLLPLLFERRAVVDEVRLEGLDVKLHRRADGVANWLFDTGAPAEPTPAEPSGGDGALPELSVAGVRIARARVELRDEQAGTHFAAEELNVATGPVAAGAPIDLDVSLRAKDYGSGATVVATLASDLVFAADAAGADLTGVSAELALSAPDLPADGVSVALTGAAVRADLDAGAAALEGIAATIRAAGVELAVDAAGTVSGDRMALSGTVAAREFSPRKLMATLGQPPLETADPDVLKAAALNANWKIAGERLELDGLKLRLDDSGVTGKLGTNFADMSATRFDLALDAIDADRYLAPAPEETSTGGGEVADETEIPADALRELDVAGRVAIGQLRIVGLQLANVTAKVTAKNGVVVIDPSSADVYGGRYAGTIRLDVTGSVPKVTVAQSLEAVQAGEILTDLYDARNLQGLLQGRIDGVGSGRTTTELTRDLKGSVTLDLDDAVYKGKDVWYEIRKTVARIKGKPQPAPPVDPQTEITALGFAGQLADGVLRSDRLAAEIPFIRVQGGGAFDLLQNQLDYRLQARMLSRPNFPDADDLADLERVTIPITVRGDATDPKIGIDLQELAKDAAVQQATDRLLKKFGLEEKQPAGEAPGAEGAEAPPEAEPAEPRDEKDAARDLIKKGLRDLIGG
jgi:AsmA protein